MSEHHSFKVPAHHNIYTRNADRELRIDFSVPQSGVNKYTGFIILVPGFGGNIDSKVYQKMRDCFADQFNLVTIQCDYFGSPFMQSADSFWYKKDHYFNKIFSDSERKKIERDEDATLFINLLSNKKTIFSVVAKMNETVEAFNDMGFMQAIDIINAFEAVKILLRENGLTFNANRVIGYGHSHGAYLLYLSNRLAPNLFSFIVDNSAWLVPAYLTSNRYTYHRLGEATLSIEFNYLAKEVIRNKHDLSLDLIYRNFKTNTQVLTFQGDNDNLVDHEMKRLLVESLHKSDFILVKKEDVDNIKYNSNSHGLDADFLELFTFALEFEQPLQEIQTREVSYAIDFDGVSINVDSSLGLPVFHFDFK